MRNAAGSGRTTSGAARASEAADLHLRGVELGHLRGGARRPLHRSVAFPVAPGIAGVAEIVGQVEIVGVIERDAVAHMAFAAVPADEIDGVGKAVAVRAPIPGLALVAVPRPVEGLGEAVGAGGPFPGDEPEYPFARRPRIGAEPGFLPDDRHEDGNRHAIPPLRTHSRRMPVVEPAVALVENGTDIIDVMRRPGATRQRYGQQEGEKHHTHRQTSCLPTQ